MKAILFLLRRYLFPKEGNLLTLGLWVSIVGVILGIVQLMVVLSVMTGFQRYLKDSYSRITSEIVLKPYERMSVTPEWEKDLDATPGVKAHTPFSFGQAMIIKNGVGGVVLEGFDFESSKVVTDWEKIWVTPPDWQAQRSTPHWIWLGVQLAKKLKINVGDEVTVFIPGRKEPVPPFKVTAITKFGIYDHDLRYARIGLGTMKNIFGMESMTILYKVALTPEADLEVMAKSLQKKLGNQWEVKRWSDVNKNLFLAVKDQKKMLFWVLEIIIALAGLNIANLLMMSSHHRKRDVAILRAMGMRFSGVFSFFVLQGAAVGVAGIGFGIGFGYLACKLVERFQPTLLSESVYNVTRLPMEIALTDVLLIAVVAFAVCVVSSLLPALRAASQRPVTALRNE